MYDNWLFITLFLFPPKKKEEEKENKVAKPVLYAYFVYFLLVQKIENSKR